MIYTDEMKEFLKSYIPGHHYKEIVEAFNTRFPVNISANQVNRFIVVNKVYTGYNGRFAKGQTSPTKGLKQTEFMSADQIENSKKTRFKPGSKPHNHMPVGSVVVATVGYNRIKIAEPNKWVMQSRWVWQQAHGQKLDRNQVIIHRNGNQLDDSLENLKMVSRKVMMEINRIGLTEDVELNDAIIALAELKAKINEKGNKNAGRRNNKVP